MQPGLTGISETMLWTLHNRASEAARPDGCLRDPMCLHIYRALHYDYERHFGHADGSHGVRSQLFDEHLRIFLAAHPRAAIVNLGEGLETQRYRIDAPEALWISVDVPEALAIRERFIQPDARHLHVRASALDTAAWFGTVPPERPCFITAQGLFMYFSEEEMARFARALAQRFPGAILMFDYISRSLSRRTLSKHGWMKTPYYRTPPMPWGVNRDELEPLFSRWLGQPVRVHNVTFVFPRGPLHWLIPMSEHYLPWLANHFPGVCWLQLPQEGPSGQESVSA